MGLKYYTKSANYVDAFDLCQYLSEKIGKSVEVVDSSNDTDYSVCVEKEEIEDYDQDTIKEFLEGGLLSFEYGYNTILTYCANQGWLEEGDYVIRVSW